MSFIRLLLIGLIFFLIYQILKSWIRSGRRQPSAPAQMAARPDPGPPEDLVQDAFTGVYFPKSEGLASLVEGRLLYFLNQENRDKYLESRSGGKEGGSI